MDISGVQTAAIASSVGQNDSVGIAVLKKAMDIQEQSAVQLIQSIPELPDNLGQNINVKV
ncbi:MAG: YjfB family protein [gamma proteobacterium symbiont of Taylorina sp.]|nr:YjfB family protein [gamma proteobacterium symbiont of Taylorina sp.]